MPTPVRQRQNREAARCRRNVDAARSIWNAKKTAQTTFMTEAPRVYCAAGIDTIMPDGAGRTTRRSRNRKLF